MSGQDISGTQLATLNDMIIQKMKRHGISAGHGPVRSSFNKDGKIVEFITYTQDFEVGSPELLELSNEIARFIHLDIPLETNKLGELEVGVAFRFDPNVEVRISNAGFSYSGKEFIAFTSDGEMHELSGKKSGNYSPDNQQLFLNVLTGNLEALIHEVLHSKVPPDHISELDSPIDQIATGIVREITTKSPELWRKWKSALEEAREVPRKTMVSFDGDLEKVIPTDEW